jgi:hypothetical protein
MTDFVEGACLMRRTELVASWVVYQATFDRKAEGMIAVCEQGEWESMERAQPGRRVLLKSGIATEGEAEQIARAKPAPVPAATA